jgi:hypothetical protein
MDEKFNAKIRYKLNSRWIKYMDIKNCFKPQIPFPMLVNP